MPDRKITLVFNVDCFPEVHSLEIIWNKIWAGHDMRWRTIICRYEETEAMKNIPQLEIVLQPSNGANKHWAFNIWQLQFLLSRLDFPHPEVLSIAQAGSWKVGQRTCGTKKCLETIYGNLAGVCGNGLRLNRSRFTKSSLSLKTIPGYMNISGSVGDFVEPQLFL